MCSLSAIWCWPVFAENVILARALGVTRLMKLVPDHRAQVWDFCLPLLLVITLSAPAGWAAHDLVFPVAA